MNVKHFKLLLGIILCFLNMLLVYAQTPTPGGVSGVNYQFVAWLTPDGYVRNGNNGTWQNNFTGGASVGNFTTQTTNRTPSIDNNWGYNFHPSVNFTKSSNADAANRLQSSSNFSLNGRNVTTFFVLRDGRTSNWWNSLITFHHGTKDLSGIAWWNNASGDLRYPASNTTIVLQNAKEGILAFDYSNGGQVYAWQNGTKETLTGSRSILNYNDRITISENGAGQYGFQGNIQEMIIVSSGANNTFMSMADRQKIHSYLAVKYGITLGTGANMGGGDYVNSAGTVVWSRAANTGYLNNVFGIARDDNSRLNQVQSRSNNSNMLTIYKGTLSTQNNNNSSAFATDKSHVMIGSNGLSMYSNVTYQQPIGTLYENVPGGIDFKLNYHSTLIYKAQVTTSGVSGNQTINIQINSSRPKYVLVSNNPAFPSGTTGTRIYPINNKTASILVNDGDYISFTGFEPLPGGLTGYDLDIWIDGDTTDDYGWDNFVAANYTLQRFSTNAPTVRLSKLNFHDGLIYGNTVRKLRTSEPYPVANGTSYHSFVVSENTGGGEKVLISYHPTGGTSAANLNDARRTSLQWNGTNQIRAGWSSVSTPAMINAPVSANNFGIASMSVRNSSTSTVYMNGSGTSFTASAPSSNERVSIGNGHNGTGVQTSLRFDGNIQEIIMMRGGNTQMLSTDVERIHSYLSIKYGITLTAGDYRNSDGIVVWDRSANSGYVNNIFGIARDDESGLYQKQSRSTSFPFITMFVNGSTLKTLNSENTGTLEDKQYFIAGSSGGNAVHRIDIPIEPNTVFLNGSIRNDIIPLNISTPIYKAQWAGFATDSLRVSMQAQQDFYYAQVSTDATFAPGNTKIYSVYQGIAEVDFVKDLVDDFCYFRFIGFAPGPGGVISDLKLWLRADDVAAMVTSNGTAGSGRLAGYSAVHGEDPNNISTVQSWSDLVREHTFGLSGVPLDPVLRPNSPEMNYHPAVFFWFNGGNAAYMNNTAGNILNDARPNEHSALFVVNNKFIQAQNDWIYTMLFSSNYNGGQYQGPGYGLNRSTISGGYAGRGRFRSNNANDTDGNGAAIGTQNLFKPDATTILSYYPKITNPPYGVNVLFRFNALEESRNTQYSANTDMRRASQLGTGYASDRTINGVMSEAIIYDRELTLTEKTQVESYLALRYGVTLYPPELSSYSTYGRFNYTLSDGTPIWNGDVDVNDLEDGKFAKHYNHIAAILRDDVERLNNRHTHSTNVGSLLHLGIAGTKLTDDASTVGYWEENMEVVIFGDDGDTGVSPRNSDCGNFDYRFNRIWYIHKMTKDDRPISLLVGAQDNRSISIGNDANTTAYYEILTPSNDIFMIVADSRDNLENGIYTAVVPMIMIDGEYQCNYTFSENDTYITFGYRPNSIGCYTPEEAQFEGSKTFRWTQYSSRTNRSNTDGLTIPSTPYPAVDLEDNIVVTSTKFVYPSGVRATTGYPRASSVMGNGGIEVRRSLGSAGQDIVITIEFNNAVIPSFSISGIDDYRYSSYDEVSISGSCSSNTYYPALTAANRTPSFTINGNTVTANQRSRLAGANKNGTVNVEFKGAVEKVEIRYRLKNRVYGTQRIFISPITLRSSFPPPPVNEDGLGFIKHTSVREVTTCEGNVSYSFQFVNTNCEGKYVHLTDELESGMVWEVGSLSLDTTNNFYNTSLKVNGYGGINELKIDSLFIPGTSEISIRATAVFDENVESKDYHNIASMIYDRHTYLLGVIIKTEEIKLESGTSIHVEKQEKPEDVELEVISERTYTESHEIEVIYKITNPNAEITDMFMDIDFNEGFIYVANSFNCYGEEEEEDPPTNPPLRVTQGIDPNGNYLSVAGDVNAATGFTLQPGITYIAFKIKAPALINIDDELDANNQPTGRKVPLVVIHNLYSEIDDSCLIACMSHLSGDVTIPFFRVSSIITNANNSTKILR